MKMTRHPEFNSAKRQLLKLAREIKDQADIDNAWNEYQLFAEKFHDYPKTPVVLHDAEDIIRRIEWMIANNWKQ